MSRENVEIVEVYLELEIDRPITCIDQAARLLREQVQRRQRMLERYMEERFRARGIVPPTQANTLEDLFPAPRFRARGVGPPTQPNTLQDLLPAPRFRYRGVVPATQPNTLQDLLPAPRFRARGVVPPTQPNTLQDRLPAPKRIRLGEPQPELQQQLRVETIQEQLNPAPAYNPQVQAIPPTGPSDNVVEDANFRPTRNYLLNQITKVNLEISKAETTTQALKKKKQNLVEAVCQLHREKDDEEDRLAQQPKHQSLAQKIYAENRRKAQKAHLEMEKLGPKVELPLYKEPSDTAVYDDNKRKHILFKKRLLEHLRSIKKGERSVGELPNADVFEASTSWNRT